MRFYDVLYQRYANPMELLDGMLMTGQLSGFVSKMIDIYCEERKDKTRWEYWLHKDWERSWPEYLQSVNDKPDAAPTQKEALDIVKDSMSIMAAFCPVSGGVEDGDIQDIRRNSVGRDESEPDT